MTKLRVLVVDDNLVNQKVALRFVERFGHTGEGVSSGLEALEHIQQQTYDVVLMDIQMPEMNGLEATRQIRAWEAAHSTRNRLWVAAVTADVRHERHEFLAAGFDTWLGKPFDAAEMRRVIEAPLKAMTESAPVVPPSPVVPALAVPLDTIADLPIFDEAAVQHLARPRASGKPPVLIELVQLYQEEAPKALAQAQAAVTACQPEALYQAAHLLKGISGNVGARRLQILCQTLEQIGKQPAPAWAQAATQLAQAEATYTQTVTALTAALQRLGQA